MNQCEKTENLREVSKKGILQEKVYIKRKNQCITRIEIDWQGIHTPSFDKVHKTSNCGKSHLLKDSFWKSGI